MKEKIVLIVIFILAFLIRTINLSDFPVGFHNDEVSIGYSAYSLLQTGRDRNGEFLPLAIDQFGDFRPAGYFYLAALSEKIFGLTEFAVRFPAALFGSLLIFPVYFLAEKIYKNKIIALLASLIVVFNPWLVIVSRSSSESIVSLFLVTLGMGLFFAWREKKNKWVLIAGVLVLILSFLFYHSSRLFVPLFLLVFLLTERKKAVLISAIMVLISLFAIFYFARGGGRVSQVSIFSHPEVRLQMEEQIREDGGQNVLLTRIFHNKIVNYGLSFLSNAGSYLTIDYLFIKGGEPIRYKISGTGLLLLTDLIFLLLAIWFQKKYALIPFLLVIFGIMPAALTVGETPNIQRSIFAALGFILLIALGQSWLWDKYKTTKNVALALLIGVVAISYLWDTAYFFHQYFVHAKTHRPWYRNYGVKELVLALKEEENNYQKIIMTRKNDNNLPFYLFFNKFPPQKYQALGSPKDADFLIFEKYEFVPFECALKVTKEGELEVDKSLRRDYLYVNMGECPDYPGLQIKKIYRPDKTIAFKIISVPEEIIRSLKLKK